MTKRLNTICLVAFFVCLAGAYVVQLLSGGVANLHGVLRYLCNILSIFIIALFPLGPISYMQTQSWREIRKDKVKRDFIRKNPLLTFLIWREVWDEEMDDEQRNP